MEVLLYFDVGLSDGNKTVRVVSFDPKLHSQFEEVKRSGCSVALHNCLLKRNAGEDFEIHVNNRSSIVKSPKKFRVDDESLFTVASSSSTLKSLKELAEHQQVSISVAVVKS